jgi:hypothetical protein
VQQFGNRKLAVTFPDLHPCIHWGPPMSSRYGFSAILALTLTYSALPAGATELDAVVLAQAGGVHGQDVMEGKNRSGPEGYVWAPLDRDKAPSGTSPTEAKGQPNRHALDQRPVPDTSKNLSPGNDPGTAMPTPNTGKATNKP